MADALFGEVLGESGHGTLGEGEADAEGFGHWVGLIPAWFCWVSADMSGPSGRLAFLGGSNFKIPRID